jgi:putative membrane protein
MDMTRASKLFTEENQRRITEAVEKAESRTSAELIPVVATASGRYDRAEDIVGLWVGLGALAVTWLLVQGVEAGPWGEPRPTLGLPSVVGLVLGGWVVGVVLAHLLPGLRRLFIPRGEEEAEVARAARQAFFDRRVHHTEGSTGLLLYVSLFEQRAVLLADAQVLEKLGQEKLDALCAGLVAELKKGAYVDGLCGTLESAGVALGEVLPRRAEDRNELPNTLAVVD